MKRSEVGIWVFAALAVVTSILISELHKPTRLDLISNRRVAWSSHTSIAFKNAFFKESANRLLNRGKLNLPNLALDMNLSEKKFQITYVWGGSIKNHLPGLDCTGFVHGLMYYLAYPESQKRFNTKAIYLKLKRDRRWQTIFDSSVVKSNNINSPDLRTGDIIVWPSALDDGRNIPGPIWGHIGVVTQYNDQQLVTHYVHSDAYDFLDLIGSKGPGINTLPAEDFIRLKQRGILAVFRQK